MEVLHNFYRVTKRKAFAKQDSQREPTKRRPSRGEYQLEKRLRENNIYDQPAMSDRSYLKLTIQNSLSPSTTLDKFIQELSDHHIETQINKSKSGLITGISFLYKGVAWKGSSISKDCGWNYIKEQLDFISLEDSKNNHHDAQTNIENSTVEDSPQPTDSDLSMVLNNLMSAASFGKNPNSIDSDMSSIPY